MCGIVGFNWSHGEEASVLVERMSHRGPDGKGIYADETVTLGHCRLAILDPGPTGFQPMFYHPQFGAFSAETPRPCALSECVAVVYNGEIYNYPELRKELEELGYRFQTRCDTECLLAAYFEWGRECVHRFNGMWAFCIYDLRLKELFLSRDRLGIKPLYYFAATDGRFIFASELKSVLVDGAERTIDENAFQHYLLLGYTPEMATIFDGIEKLPPATNLIFDLTSRKVVRKDTYWHIRFTDNFMTEEQAVVELRRLLEDAVKKRLLADVPVGAFLSGGLDSSIICALMRPHVSQLKTFSIRFDHPEFDESVHAQAVADHLQTRHVEIAFNAGDVRNLLNALSQYFDEPFADASMIPTYLVASVAAKEVKVCLSGTGGDELFAGYTRYREYLLLRKMAICPDWIKKMLIALYQGRNSDKGAKLRELLFNSRPQELYLKLLSHLFRGEAGGPDCLSRLRQDVPLRSVGDGLNALLESDQTSYLPGDLLVKEDRSTMAHHLEGRVPFLDYRLVEFANQLPEKLKMRGPEGKILLKKAFGDLLPPFVPARKKQGFGVPLKHYFRAELHGYSRELLLDGSRAIPWNPRELETLWKRHQAGESDYSPLFLNLIMFRLWSERYLPAAVR